MHGLRLGERSRLAVIRRVLLSLAICGLLALVVPARGFSGFGGLRAKRQSVLAGSTTPLSERQLEAVARASRVRRHAFGVEFLAAPVYMEWPALAAGACAVALMLGVQLEQGLKFEQGFWRELVAVRRRFNIQADETPETQALKVEMPCCTEEGSALLDTLNECGQDGFFRHLQTTLLTLREDVRKEMQAEKAFGVPSSKEEEEQLLLRRMDELAAKEKRERTLTDIFAIGTWVKMRTNGLNLIQDIDHFNGLEMHLGDSIVSLPADIALEVRGFVFNCLGAELGSRTVLRLRRSNAAALLLGGVSVGYCLSKLALKSYSSVSAVVQKGWASESAFVFASAWVGNLVHLQPDSDDVLEQYASLRDASMDVQAELLPQECKRVDGGHAEVVRFSQLHQPTHLLSGDVMAVTVEDFRTLLGYACTVGFTLQQWESKIASWFLQHLR
eukprot:TRINITY_DN1938_c0_g1_i2.p1 TRINITY_DN1938_c0_g1~~TRINITY_DN1938_c0_g1_i2.p1  ORF type:complete len:444 (-),score=92.58 TRINITY_DN1938_c0_g1_i2:394-1725(-)